jgi:hypothetical protein
MTPVSTLLLNFMAKQGILNLNNRTVLLLGAVHQKVQNRAIPVTGRGGL